MAKFVWNEVMISLKQLKWRSNEFPLLRIVQKIKIRHSLVRFNEVKIFNGLVIGNRGNRGNGGNRKGCTLVHLQIGLFILTILLLGLTAKTTYNLGADPALMMKSTATKLVQSKIQELQTQHHSGHPIASGHDVIKDFKRSWTIYENRPLKGQKMALIEVTWSPSKGSPPISMQSQMIFKLLK